MSLVVIKLLYIIQYALTESSFKGFYSHLVIHKNKVHGIYHLTDDTNININNIHSKYIRYSINNQVQ